MTLLLQPAFMLGLGTEKRLCFQRPNFFSLPRAQIFLDSHHRAEPFLLDSYPADMSSLDVLEAIYAQVM